MTIVVVDGMGGGIGAQLIERIKKENIDDLVVVALATNAVAAQRMLDAGADRGASGENAIRVSVGSGDVIVGPIGIVLPDAMMGEVSPAMAEAIMSARGRKLLLPLAQQHVTIVGVASRGIGELIEEAVSAIVGLAEPHR